MQKTAQKHCRILGVSIISNSSNEVLRQVRQNILRNQKFLIVTPNPEQVIRAQKDPKFRSILNKAEISVPDAIGLSAAAKFLSLPNPNKAIRPIILIFQGLAVGLAVLFDRGWLESEIRVLKGRELFLEVIKLANKKKWKVVFIGDSRQSAQKAAAKLKVNFKGINLYSFEGPELLENGSSKSIEDEVLEEKLVSEIDSIKPQLMIVGFGAPKQEKWAEKWRGKINVIGTMVVGGTFDYIAGTSKLPPKLFEDFGLEWLWRLLSGSQKLKRILIAFPVFPIKIFLSKLNSA